MLKSVYDPNHNGKVQSSVESDHAALADAVPWSGISEKPDGFAPIAHTHEFSDIGNPVYQRVYSGSDPRTLYLCYPIIRNTKVNTRGTIELEFTGIQDKEGGNPYIVQDNEMLTWEYHVLCSIDIAGVITGSLNCNMVGVNIPENLELINGRNTYHVFVIRAIRHTDSVNGVKYQANYAYSYEE